jgi:hypothetical protein
MSVSIKYKGNEIASMTEDGTKTLQTKGKYCEDNISVTQTIPSGGGGEQPQLHAPSITVSGTVLNIENPAGNGDFVSSFGVYLNGSHFGDTQAISVDLSSRDLIPDTANIQVTAKGEKFIESEKSNNILYRQLYNIGFYDGEEKVESEKVGYGLLPTAPTITKVGYKLDGWYKEADFSGDEGITPVVSDQDYFAKFIKALYLQDSGRTQNIATDGYIVISPDGKYAAFVYKYTLYVYDLSVNPYVLVGTAVVGSEISGYGAWNVAWISNETIIASGHYAGNATGIFYDVSPSGVVKGAGAFPSGYAVLGIGTIFAHNNTVVWLPFTGSSLYVFDSTTTTLTFIKEITIPQRKNQDTMNAGFVGNSVFCYFGTVLTSKYLYFVDLENGTYIEKPINGSSQWLSTNAEHAVITDSSNGLVFVVYDANGTQIATATHAMSNTATTIITDDDKIVCFSGTQLLVLDAITCNVVQSETLDFTAKYRALAASPLCDKVYCVDTNNIWREYFINKQ